MDNEVLQFKTRLGKEAQTHGRYFHGPPQGQADGANDSGAQAVGPGPDQAKHCQQHKAEHGHSASGANKSHFTTLKVRRQRVSSKKCSTTCTRNPTLWPTSRSRYWLAG